MSLETAFRDRIGTDPVGVWRAPGRVNLIGDHTDYADGFVLPFAIDRETRIAARLRDDDRIRVVSLELGEAETIALEEIRPRHGSWESYVLGVAALLAEQARPPRGVDLVCSSTVPIGGGLSSSAALSCAAAVTLDALWELGREPTELALVAQRAEREYAGVPCGVMDQLASIHGRADHALLIDTRATEVEPMPFPPRGVVPLVIDTRVAHAVGAGAYAERLASCDAAAAVLGVAALRDATPDQVRDADLDPVTKRRARHVVTENARVLAAADALRRRDAAELGRLMLESHVSLRDDHEVSCPELDVAVEAAIDAGALGARMTGAGFGGSAIVLAPAADASRIGTATLAALTAAGAPDARMIEVQVADGAGRVPTGD